MTAAGPVALAGFMAVGKTTIGRQLAGRLAVSFVDLDEEVARVTGRTPAAWIREEGEPTFRAVEVDTLRRVLVGRPGVVALGGGTLHQASARDALAGAGARVLVLDAPLDELWPRLAGTDRPLAAQAETLYAARRAELDALGARVVDVAGLGVHEVLARVAQALGLQP